MKLSIELRNRTVHLESIGAICINNHKGRIVPKLLIFGQIIFIALSYNLRLSGLSMDPFLQGRNVINNIKITKLLGRMLVYIIPIIVSSSIDSAGTLDDGSYADSVVDRYAKHVAKRVLFSGPEFAVLGSW